LTAKYGLFVWHIQDCLPLDQLLMLCSTYNISALCVKVADGTFKFNQVDAKGKQTGNDSYLKGVWIKTLEEGGIEVHGWIYPYSLPAVSPGTQAKVAVERVKTLGLRSLKLDIEEAAGAGWKTSPYRYSSAKTYMEGLKGLPSGHPVGMCSYRYPTAHPTLPWKEFLRADRMTHVAQQCYWVGAHNPGSQLLKSVSEYDDIRVLPQEPLGAMYSTPSWSPTPADIANFIQTGISQLGIEMFWFWSLDSVVAKNRYDLLEPAASLLGTPSQAPSLTPFYFRVKPGVLHLEVKAGPGQYHPKVGSLPPGEVVALGDIDGTDAWGLILDGPFKGRYVCIKKAVRYMEPT